jgi:hypothetical protein
VQGETKDLALALERSARSLHLHLILVNQGERKTKPANGAGRNSWTAAPQKTEHLLAEGQYIKRRTAMMPSAGERLFARRLL